MSDLSRRVEKLEEITGGGPRGTQIVRVNGECKHAKSCPKIDAKVEEAAANGPVVRLITNVDLYGEERIPECSGCNTFEKVRKGDLLNEPIAES